MDTTHKVSIIGTGFIGKVHLYSYITQPFYSEPFPCNTRITHLVAAHEESARNAATLVPYDVNCTTDWRSAILDPDVDIVHICTPNIAHKDALLLAIGANKNIYCEKPLVSSAAEAEEINQALMNYTGVSQMTFHHRFFASVMAAKELISSGHIGRILEFRGAYVQNSHANPDLPARWKNFRRFGGGVLHDTGSHLIDLTDWLVGGLGTGPNDVTAMKSIPFRTRLQTNDSGERVPVEVDAEDAVAMVWRTGENSVNPGAIGTLQVSKLQNGHENDLTLEIYGTCGAVRIDCMRPHYLDFCDASGGSCGNPLSSNPSDAGWTTLPVGHRYSRPDTTFPATKSAIGWTRAHIGCLSAFLRNVSLNTPDTSLDLGRGVKIQRMLGQVEAVCK